MSAAQWRRCRNTSERACSWWHSQLRRGELLGHGRADLEIDRAPLHVRETRVTLMGGRTLTKAPKTKAGRRSVSVPEDVLPALAGHLERLSTRAEKPSFA
ncbi:MAG: hypothetical protein ABSD78_14150 [Acidimicrobiales bacterium]